MMRWLCSWLTHRLDFIQYFPNRSVKCKCRRCGQYFVLNSEYEVFCDWSEMIEDHYKEMTGARTIN